MSQRCTSRENLSGSPAIPEPSAAKWSRSIGPLVWATPVVGADGTIYVGGTDLYALRPADGSQAWVSLVGHALGAPTITADGTILVVDDNEVLHAIAPDGTVKWTYDMGPDGMGDLSSPAVAADGTIYVMTGKGLYSIAPGGTLHWFQSGGYTSSATLGPDGTVYVATSFQVYAIHPNQVGAWSFPVNGQTRGDPIVGADGTIYVASDATTSSTLDGYVYALDPSGQQKWALDLGTVPGSLTVGHDGTIYTLDLSGNVDAISPSGTLAWSTPFTGLGIGYCGAFVVAADGTLYVACGHSSSLWSLSALSPSNGKQLWTFSTPYAAASSPAIGADGTLYFGYDHLMAVGP